MGQICCPATSAAKWVDAGIHYVLEQGGEVIDISSRQFRDQNPLPLYEPLDVAAARWESCYEVVPDRDRDHVPTPPWRLLAEAEPPGDLDDWPYPRHLLDSSSPWYRPPA